MFVKPGPTRRCALQTAILGGAGSGLGRCAGAPSQITQGE